MQAQFLTESSVWQSQLAPHPSIILWVVFNEAWGQFDQASSVEVSRYQKEEAEEAVQVTREVMRRDPSRLVSCASGWIDQEVGTT